MVDFKNIYNIVQELHPLYYEKHKKWFNDSYDICNNMLLKYDDEISEIFVVQYFINNFQEEHTNIIISFPDYYNLKYANIFAYFNGDILHVTQSNDNRINIGSSITMINNKPFKEYINEFMLYNGGIHDDYMDMKYQSNFIFIDYKNMFFEKPNTIMLDNKTKINLKYSNFNSDINILDFFTYDIIDQRYSINKKLNHIYMHIHDFDTIIYDDLINLLPCDELTIDLKNNFVVSVFNVEKFFKIVYNIDIQLGIHVKLNKYTNSNVIFKKMKNILNKSFYCRCPIIKKYINKVVGPKLNVYVNEFSRSSSKAFINIVKLLVPDFQIHGIIDTDDLCGTSIAITTPDYELNIPTMCYSFNECSIKKLDFDFNKL
jgi:hypothetical protein